MTEPQVRGTDRNEAAERLRLLFASGVMIKHRDKYADDLRAALDWERRRTVERIHDSECQFAGGGMCYRLECSTLDRLRAALDPATPGEEAQREW